MKDPIIAEVWRNRDSLAARYGHQLDAIVEALKKKQPRSLVPARANSRGKKRRAA